LITVGKKKAKGKRRARGKKQQGAAKGKKLGKLCNGVQKEGLTVCVGKKGGPPRVESAGESEGENWSVAEKKQLWNDPELACHREKKRGSADPIGFWGSGAIRLKKVAAPP